MQRGLIAEIDLKSLVNNLNIVKGLAKNSEIIAVVKADAYGHGSIEISKTLINEGINILAVAFSSEAIELREAGISCKIISLFDVDIDSVLNYSIIPTISNIKQAQRLSYVALQKGIPITAYIKIDTGMGRTGFDSDNLETEILEVFSLKGLVIEGVFSHFSEADLKDNEFAYSQIKRLTKIRSLLFDKGIVLKYWHISNSSALMSLPEANLDAVRPGLILYGYSTLEDNIHFDLRPVMTVKTKILQIRKVKANKPISYGRTFITKRDSNIA
ncbi:MAG: alanine racemase, partial [Thermodesulfovibrionales bacterium]|nr:alanine racemase [Thermodesulfovibrionales bacterium]